jgi:hypothetical protein
VVSETIAATTEAVINNSQIMEYWYDGKGIASPKKDITYAFCCMPEGK